MVIEGLSIKQFIARSVFAPNASRKILNQEDLNFLHWINNLISKEPDLVKLIETDPLTKENTGAALKAVFLARQLAEEDPLIKAIESYLPEKINPKQTIQQLLQIIHDQISPKGLKAGIKRLGFYNLENGGDLSLKDFCELSQDALLTMHRSSPEDPRSSTNRLLKLQILLKERLVVPAEPVKLETYPLELQNFIRNIEEAYSKDLSRLLTSDELLSDFFSPSFPYMPTIIKKQFPSMTVGEFFSIEDTGEIRKLIPTRKLNGEPAKRIITTHQYLRQKIEEQVSLNSSAPVA